MVSKQTAASVFAGVLTAGILGLFASYASLGDDVVELQAEHRVYIAHQEVMQQTLESLESRQAEMAKSQESIKINVAKLEAHAENQKESLREIVRLLRE